MTILLHPAYIPNIETFATIVQNKICWEVCDNYQKQTYRNRAYVCTDNGKHMINIPIQHVGKKQGRQKYKDIKVKNDYHWQRLHWRTLQTAYRTSPFFEYYEDDIASLYTKEFVFLLDFNLKTIEIICNCLQIATPLLKTEIYEPEVEQYKDLRFLINAKRKNTLQQKEYVQLFNDRNPFIENLSVLDLIFNEGTNALAYLKNIKPDPINA